MNLTVRVKVIMKFMVMALGKFSLLWLGFRGKIYQMVCNC